MDSKQFRIKTFARRESRITPAQKRALAELLHKYQLPATDLTHNWTEVFPKFERFAIEIGFGDGEYLVQQALQNENTAYLGIEVFRPGVGKCLLGLQKNNIENVRISTSDARDVLSKQVVSNSVNEVAILFPDPWPKARHRKRRLINEEFISLCVDRLVIGGNILIATDSYDYFEQVLSLLESNSKLECINSKQEPTKSTDFSSKTRYARKAAKSGHAVHEMLYSRLAENLEENH